MMNEVLSPLEWSGGALRLLDQRLLPVEEVWREYRDYRGVAEAIREMVVRGAPAIGCAAAYGVVLGAREVEAGRLGEVYDTLAATRPTAVNLFWALERMKRVSPQTPAQLEKEAIAIHVEDIASCRAIGEHGAPLLPEGTVLTHCNAGALATGGYGTALGVIRSAVAHGRRLRVLADETRPFLQGARLTAWELGRSGIPVTLITDNMAGHFMARGEVQAVIVGADRIARNGDTANKIGTYSVAVLAREHGIPFIVAAPRSTVDLSIPDGTHIPIEERTSREVTHVGGVQVAPLSDHGVAVRNPAFDVTPARYISAIVTERGVARAPFEDSLVRMLG
ncbi:MAG TPA: S-methyl-5-thioribose-1-phosphate isomerase [Polyangia bacterium]|jgi:methylthioribose-1-phosphate isomerase|nr:S-methyl-5-thioribose-1-phosphate isomerase [Polyangia bacterium]